MPPSFSTNLHLSLDTSLLPLICPQRHGCAVTACCRFFARFHWLPVLTGVASVDKTSASAARAAFPLVLAQAPARSWGHVQRLRILSKCAIMNQLIMGLCKPLVADVTSQRKLRSCIGRHSLCQIVSEQFDVAGRCAVPVNLALPKPPVQAFEGHHTHIAGCNSTDDGARKRSRA